MSFKCVFIVLIVSAYVLARPETAEAVETKPADPKGSTPFYSGVSAEGQKAFEKVIGNKDLTIAEVEARLAELADKYKVSDEFKQFQANSAADLAKIKKQQHELIEKLYSVSEELDSIYANKDQTVAQQEKALDTVVKSNQKLIPFISSETSRKIRLTLTCTITF